MLCEANCKITRYFKNHSQGLVVINNKSYINNFFIIISILVIREKDYEYKNKNRGKNIRKPSSQKTWKKLIP